MTQVVNDLVNGAGMTFWPRLAGETGASPAELTRANFVAREIFGSLPLRQELTTYDNVLDAAVQTRMRVEMRTLVERASRWLVTNRRPPLDSQATVDYFAGSVQRVMAALPGPDDRARAGGVPGAARRAGRQGGARGPRHAGGGASRRRTCCSGSSRSRNGENLDPAEVARLHFALGERLGLPALVGRILALPREDRWQTMARAALRDDLHSVHAQLTRKVLLDDVVRGLDPGAGRRLGGRGTANASPARPRRWRRSAPTRWPTWRGSRWACGSCAGCCPLAERRRPRGGTAELPVAGQPGAPSGAS